VALCVLGFAVSAAAADRGLKGRQYVENEVIVKFKPHVILENARATVGATVPGAFVANSLSVRTRTGVGRLALVRVPRGQATVEELVAQFSSLFDVEYAEPNYVASVPDGEVATPATATPWPPRTFGPPGSTSSEREISADSLVATGVYPSEYYSQWGWSFVDADVIWTNANASPLVAVIDTGVDYTHPDLAGKVVKGYNFVEYTADPMDDHGHGTHVSGVIAARLNNKVGIPGVSNGSVLAIKALDFSGFGTYFEIAQAIYSAASNAAVKVINMSLGGYGNSSTMYDAVRYAVVTKGKLLVAAAGNSNTDVRHYPAAYADDPVLLDRVISVAASGVYATGSTSGSSYFVQGCKASYSNYGTWVSVVGPGTNITSTMPTKANASYVYNYGTMSGTSMASPHVAAVAARVWSLSPTTTNVRIGQRLTGVGATDYVYRANTNSVDVDSDGTADLALCWDPAWATQGGTAGRTLPSLAQANVAMGMQRGEISAWVYDATNGLTLPPGTVFQAWLGSTLKGQATMTSVGQMYVVVSNLPWTTSAYTVRVNKTGYTSGSQTIGYVWLSPGWVNSGYYTDVAIPKLSTRLTFVTNWYTFMYDIDQHLLLPPDKPFDVGTSLGAPKTRLTSTGDYGVGTLGAYPYARYMADSYFTSYMGVDTTAVKGLYSTATGPYRLIDRDYASGYDLSYGMRYGSSYPWYPVGPVMRMWQSGVIKKVVTAETATLQSSPVCSFVSGGTATCDKWYVGDLSSTGVFTPRNIIGDGTSATGFVVPYGGAAERVGIARTPR
jgi:subtilisin family serine protease